MAATVARALSFKTFWRKVAVGVAVFLVFLNIRLTVVYSSPRDGPDRTWERYGHELAIALFLKKELCWWLEVFVRFRFPSLQGPTREWPSEKRSSLRSTVSNMLPHHPVPYKVILPRS